MKPSLKILTLLLVAMLAVACNKSPDIQPVKNELYGVWRNEAANLQWTITNTKGLNDGARFTDYRANGHRYLKVEALEIKDTFEINSVTDHQLDLTDSKGVNYLFIKMPVRANH
ncbi:hypothetical protein AB6735_18635 [Mucilaginibacter sp. RCC_168]|uniref:hypothetical protein n=1 Tax=Mucilaginibacter sp. RCC_168 TaxID=3239221 RepID=UPI0035248631